MSGPPPDNSLLPQQFYWDTSNPVAGKIWAGVPLVENSTGRTLVLDTGTFQNGVLSVCDFGAIGDGLTDDAPAIQAAIDHAASFSTPRPVYAPAGVYALGAVLTMGTAPGQCLRGDEGGTVFLLGLANVSNPCMLNINPGAKRLTVEGITWDGNAANTAFAAPLVQLATWSDNITIRRCRFRNSNHTAINAPGDAPIVATLTATAAAGQPTFQFASPPVGLKPGAGAAGNAYVDSDMYLVAVSATAATFNRSLPDTVLSGSNISFSHAFATSADTFYGDTVLPATDTTGLAVGMSVATAGNGCFQSYTRIAAISVNASVTLDRFLLNKLPAGSNVAASMGHSRFTVEGCHFHEIGQSRMTAGSRSYNTVGVQSSGSSQLTLKNFGATWAGRVGIYPGQKTAMTGLPAGVPPNTLVRDLTVNSAANTHTITLASPLTASIPDNTPVPFQTATGGAGYGIWHGWGAAFSQTDAKFINNRFEHTWAACIWATGTGRTLFMGNHYIQDQMEFRDPNVAPSPCIALGAAVSPRIIGEYGRGASGTAVEGPHVVGLLMSGCEFSENGLRGVSLSGGHSNVINGVIVNNNGQYKNIPVAQDYSVATGGNPSGMSLLGTANFTQPGTMANISVSDVIASDTQNAPTQYFGMMAGYASATWLNYYQGALIGTGNITATYDPVLAGKAQGNVWSVAATWMQGAGKPTSTQPAGSLYSRNNGASGTTLYITRGAGIWNPVMEGDGTKPGEGVVLYQTGASAGNGPDTTEDVLQSYSLPAGTLANVGDIVHIVAGGTFAATTDTKAVNLRFGGIAGVIGCNPSGASVALTRWAFEAWMVKTGTSTQSFISIGHCNGTTSGTSSNTSALNDTLPIQIVVTGRNSTNPVAGSVSAQYFTVEALQ